ncbi:MAG: hypothetical protein GY795_50755 [Desulfobacterales bacterium]|nr:hypothetical protein [Desulfobacterales bacterium]
MKFWPAGKGGEQGRGRTVKRKISDMRAGMLRFRSAHLRRRPKFHFGTPFFHDSKFQFF